MKKTKFGFEELDVWHKAIEFAQEVIKLTSNLKTDKKHFRLVEQVEAAASSVSMNIAEGKGRYSKKEFVQFLYIARGSLYETVTLLTIFCKNDWMTEEELNRVKIFAEEITKMLSGLIRSVKFSMA